MRWVAAITLGLLLMVGGFGNPPARSAPPSAATADLGRPLAAASADDMVTPVLVSLVGGDTAVVRGSDGRYHVVYELLLINTAPGPATLASVAVLMPRAATRCPGSTAARSSPAKPPDAGPRSGGECLAGSQRSARPPANGQFRCSGRRPASAHASPRHPEPEPVHDRTGPVLGMSPAPWTCLVARRPFCRRRLRGQGWVASDGCCDPSSHHRNGLFPINGWLYAGQRFAIDWLQIDDQGRLATGAPTSIANWVANGAPVLAVTGGVVIATLDGLQDQVPVVLPDQGDMTLDEADGNHVVIAHDDGLYSFYATSSPAPSRSRWATAQAGRQLGLLGNSGRLGRRICTSTS